MAAGTWEMTSTHVFWYHGYNIKGGLIMIMIMIMTMTMTMIMIMMIIIVIIIILIIITIRAAEALKSST